MKFAKTHEWMKELEDGVVEIGLTDFAQNAMGSVVFVNLPQVGDEVEIEEAFGDVESVKAVSDVISPVAGEVLEVNEELESNPGLINEAPWDAWLIRVKAEEISEELLDEAGYEKVCAEEA